MCVFVARRELDSCRSELPAQLAAIDVRRPPGVSARRYALLRFDLVVAIKSSRSDLRPSRI
jgi:hypothetical protein